MIDLRGALPALGVALAGVGLAWLGFKTIWVVPLVLVAGVAGISQALFLAGKARVKRSPTTAIRLMGSRLLVPGSLAAGAAGLLIAIAVTLNPGEDASAQTKELLTASVAALTGFFTTLFIKDAESADEKWVAAPIAAVFETAFAGTFEPESPGALAVFAGTFAGHTGWGPEARAARAQAVEAALAAHR